MIGLMSDHRHGLWLLCSCLCGIALAGRVLAQPAAGPSPRAERPDPVLMQIAPVDPKLDALLKDWERKTAGIKTLHGVHTRKEFNTVFASEEQSEGMFFFEAPDKGRIDIKGMTPEKGQISRKKDPQGNPYQIKPGRDQIWICNGQQILMVDPPQKQYERMPIPPEMQGNNIIRSPLPFLFGMKAEDMKRRFQMKWLKEYPDGAVLIEVVPRTREDSQNYSKAYVKLNTTYYIPSDVQLADPGGTAFTEYHFDMDKLKINQQGLKQVLFRQDPFNPSLLTYKEVQAPNGGGVQPAGNQQPALPKTPLTPKNPQTSLGPQRPSGRATLPR